MKFTKYKEPISFTISYIAEINDYSLKIYQDCCGWHLHIKTKGSCYLRHYDLRNFYYKAKLLVAIDEFYKNGELDKICDYRGGSSKNENT